jgi:polyisoprenoid-binding protein YceI
MMTIQTMLRGLAAATALGLALGGPLLAQPAMPKPSHDYNAAPAGAYALDPKHTGLIIRVSHLGFSYEVFRFQTVAADLTWDPAHPAADKLNATVDPKSIVTGPVEGFSQELSNQFLKTAQFPTATFVSRAFHVVDPTHGKVEGDLTLLGQTKPATFDVELVGAGPQFHGPVLGVTARTMINPADYGLPPFMSEPIELVIDTEFHKQG